MKKGSLIGVALVIIISLGAFGFFWIKIELERSSEYLRTTLNNYGLTYSDCNSNLQRYNYKFTVGNLSLNGKNNEKLLTVKDLSVEANVIYYVWQHFLYKIKTYLNFKQALDVIHLYVTAKVPVANNVQHVKFTILLDVIAGKARVVDLPKKSTFTIFKNTYRIENNNIKLNFKKIQDAWELALTGISVEGFNLNANASFKRGEILDFSLNASGVKSVHKILSVIPFKNEKVISVGKWLQQNLKKGDITTFNFNYNTSGSNLTATFANADLFYSSRWPSLNKCSGKFSLDATGLKLQIQKGLFFGETIQNLTLSESQDDILVQGSLTTNIKKGIDFLQQTSLLSTKISSHLDKATITGDFGIDINFKVPIKNTNPGVHSFVANLSSENAEIKVGDVLDIANIKTKLALGDNSIIGSGIGTINSHKTVFEVKNIDDADVLLTLQSSLAAADIFTGNAKLQDNVEGTIDVALQAVYNMKTDIFTTHLKSDFSNIISRLPEPLLKEKQEKLTFELKSQQENNNNYISLHLANKFIAKLQTTDGKLTRGHIVLGKSGRASLPESNALYIEGRVPVINFMPFWDKFSDDFIAKISLAIPLDLSLNVEKLKLGFVDLDNTWLRFTNTNDILEFDNNRMLGSIRLTKEGATKIHFKRLELDKGIGATTKVIQRSLGNLNADVKCDNLFLQQNYLGDISFSLHDLAESYVIKNIKLQHKLWQMQGQGELVIGDGNIFKLQGKMISKNVGTLLNAFNIPGFVYKGKGSIDFNLAWHELQEFSWQHSHGNIHLDLTQGQLKSIDPGMGRLVGLLSLQNLGRRLTLDFRDFFAEDYYFDRMHSDLSLNSGVLSSSELLIRSPAAKIKLSGSADISNHSLNVDMRVISKGGASLPIAVAMAATNPIAGAAVWALDQTIGAKSTSSDSKYKVTGNWSNPIIKELMPEKNTAKSHVSRSN